jgi:hypothetical protein
LSAYKYSFLTQVSRELRLKMQVWISLDSSLQQTGNAMGFAINNALTVGTGTVEPNGIVTRAGSAVTGTS